MRGESMKLPMSKPCSPSGQKGMVLIVGLIMLLLMTVVGLAAIRGSGLQEAMAGNMRDRNLAFQAAEAGLSAGEAYVRSIDLGEWEWSGDGEDQPDASLAPDLNRPGAGTPVQNWTRDDWGISGWVRSSDLNLSYVASSPRFVVEDLEILKSSKGSSVEFGSELSAPIQSYRITSRGVGGTENSEAIVQSIYRR
jgi:type IV pilus assembly protein PilX